MEELLDSEAKILQCVLQVVILGSTHSPRTDVPLL